MGSTTCQPGHVLLLASKFESELLNVMQPESIAWGASHDAAARP